MIDKIFQSDFHNFIFDHLTVFIDIFKKEVFPKESSEISVHERSQSKEIKLMTQRIEEEEEEKEAPGEYTLKLPKI